MRMSASMVPLYPYDGTEILAALPEEDDPLWEAFTLRQKMARQSQSHTRSIAFKWTDLNSEPIPEHVMTPMYAPEALSKAVMRCVESIEQYYGGIAVTVLLAELRARGEIKRHCDSGPVLQRTHRCHLPILTNPDVRFIIDGTEFHLGVGQFYEIDNILEHAVRNDSAMRRVHLVCNVLESGSGKAGAH
jgi:hypothetical protein